MILTLKCIHLLLIDYQMNQRFLTYFKFKLYKLRILIKSQKNIWNNDIIKTCLILFRIKTYFLVLKRLLWKMNIILELKLCRNKESFCTQVKDLLSKHTFLLEEERNRVAYLQNRTQEVDQGCHHSYKIRAHWSKI